jgi:PAS domain S-box-containing protein
MVGEKTDPDLFESERNFRLLIEGITDYAIYMLDPEGRVTNWNAGAERIKGYKASEVVGKHFSVFLRPKISRTISRVSPLRRLATKDISPPKAGDSARITRDFLRPS